MILNKKILILSTYPVEEPLHGGQKRVEAIIKFYKDHFLDVKFVAVFHRKYFDKYGVDDIPIEDAGIIKNMEEAPFASDLISGEAIYYDTNTRQRLKLLLQQYRPDIIQMEQIYPFAGIELLLPEISLKPKLILSAQNDETRLKKDIFSGIRMPKKEKERLLEKIEGLEKRAIKNANLVIAVNKSDAQKYVELGAKKCIVIPNGIAKITPTPAALAHWRKFKDDHKVEKLVTFVGSAHPPNLTGFHEMIGTDLSFLPNTACIMLAGGISNYIQQEYGSDKAWAKKFWKKAWPLGSLSDDNLAGLIQQSEVIVLPIVYGVGSNLKTAEAILADKKVVATTLAFSTFEEYRALPNIHLADSQQNFKQSIIDAIDSAQVKRSQKQMELAEKVQWQYCLEPLGDTLEALAYGRTVTTLKHIKRNLVERHSNK